VVSIENGKKAWFTTSWDDGHPLDKRLAELLAKYGIPGTFYIPLENPKRPVMDRAAIRSLSAAFDIGAHTVHHAEIDGLPDSAAEMEITAPKKIFEDLTGKPCRMFCFPRGYFKPSQLRFVRDAGFLAARTVELLSVAFPRMQDGVLVMPTTMQAYEHSRKNYLRNIGKRKAVINLLNFLRSKGSNWVETSEWFMCEAERTGGVFHLWGHSWEIDKWGLWEPLEQVFQKMAEHRASVHFADNSEVCEYALSHREAQNPAGTRPLRPLRR
jgi:peptidoglycan/xylan/chitin deacetylase (PgdA/CDA1 family)